ncbi:MAG: ABC transporter permease [Thermoprotei archaeon]
MISSSPYTLMYYIVDAQVTSAILVTILSAAFAAVLSFILGTPLAYILARYDFPGKYIIDSVVDLPMIIPHLVAGIALLIVWGPRGLLGTVLSSQGIRVTDTFLGIVIAELFVSFPLYVRSVESAIRLIDPSLEKVSRTLGASHGFTFYKVILPLIKNAIFTGLIVSWARGMSEFGAVIVLTYVILYGPFSGSMSAPVLIYNEFTTRGLYNALPITSLLVLVSLILFITLKIIQRRGGVYGSYG